MEQRRIIQSEEGGRIRGLRKEDVRTQLERRLIGLGIGESCGAADPDLACRLARALRRERRAASGRVGNGYDPLRHLLLVRFARLGKGQQLRGALLAFPLQAERTAASHGHRSPSRILRGKNR